MKRILDEPPCRASMKNSGNKRMIERKGSWKHKVNPCNDLDGASRRDNAENLELQKRKDEASRTENVIWWPTPERKMNHLYSRIYSSWIISGRKELNHLEEIRIRFIVCLSFISHFRTLMVVRSRFFFFDYHINSFVFPSLPMVHEDFLKLTLYLSYLFQRE